MKDVDNQYISVLNKLFDNKKNSKSVLLVLIIGYVLISFLDKIKVTSKNDSLLNIAIISVVIIFFAFLKYGGKKKQATEDNYKAAVDALEKEDYSQAFDHIKTLYEQTGKPQLAEILTDLSLEQGLLQHQIIYATELFLQDNQDDKVRDILSQMQKIVEKIDKHTKNIASVREKILELSGEISKAPDNVTKDDLRAIISRYEKILQLEQTKFEFYQKIFSELDRLRKRHIFRKKIIAEESSLNRLEQSVLQSSIAETFSDSPTAFIDEEKAYLDALDEYSDKISEIADYDLFEEIRQNFERKIKNQ